MTPESLRRFSETQQYFPKLTCLDQHGLERYSCTGLLLLLDELPAETREILVLRYMLEWRVQEIARHLGITENSISVMIHRALARLRVGWQENEVCSAQAFEEAGRVDRKEKTS